MPDLRDYCERLWRGEIDVVREAHPVTSTWNNREAEEIEDGFLYIKSAASMNTIDTGDGLVMLDTGTARDAEGLYHSVRAWRPDTALRSAVFSHHHVDHIFGVGRFDDEAASRGQPRPVVYGQRHIPAHFDRYKRTVGYNTAINSRQFIRPGMDAMQVRLPWPDEFRYPDVTFEDQIRFSVGELSFEVTHTRGETEDAAWTWIPEKKWLFPGDLFIWAVPNAGNPQKAQRWAGEWAAGLRQMAGKGAELMSPGHGLPIFGADRIAEALNDTADLLESIENQTLAMMNLGYTLDRILHEIEMPQDLLEKPWLSSAYDHPEFIVHTVWRYFAGWYEGEPDRLLPAPRSAEAAEWVTLAGGLEPVMDRARAHMANGNLQMACHLIEGAALAAPNSPEVHELRSEIYDARANEQDSSMARGIFSFAASSSRHGKRDVFNP